MTAISLLLATFLAIGVFTRSYNRRTRILMSVAIIATILYMFVSRGN